MSSNYSSDPNNAASISNPSTPQSDKAVSSVAPQPFSVSNSFSAEPDSPGSGGGMISGNLRRLAAGTMLSGGGYRIEKPGAAGGMGAVYRAIEAPFSRPGHVTERLDEFQTDTELAP